MQTLRPYQQHPLHPYQQQCKDFVLRTPKCGLFLDPGLGKTRITLEALTEMNPHGHVLICAPKLIARATWLDEISKWQYPLRTKSLIVNDKFKDLTRAKRLKRYEEVYTDKPTVYFINQELLCDLLENAPRSHGAPVWYFPNLIIDECQNFKSYKAQRFKAMKLVQPAVSRYIGLTGSPNPNGLMDLWSQIYLMDGGARLGRTITAYRQTFFNEGLRVNGYPVKWIPKPGAEDEIYRRIADLCISVKADLKLPPTVYNDFPVYLDDKELKQFRSFAREMVLDLESGGQVVAVNRGILAQKLAQLASGSAYVEPGSHEYRTIHKHKLETCEYIVNNAQGSVIIAYHYWSERDMLLKHFPGAVDFDGSPAMQAEWNAGNIPVMLLQPASAGRGLNLQDGGHTLIWYTIYPNLEEYIQTNARLARQGQKHPIVIHHLLAQGTTDAANLALLQQKDDAEQRLMDSIRAIAA